MRPRRWGGTSGRPLNFSVRPQGEGLLNTQCCGVALIGAVAFLLSGNNPSLAQSAADRQTIQNLIQAHATAWNHRDAKAAAAIMTPDAVWVTSSGVTLRGRSEIEQAHVRWFAEDSAAGGSTHTHPPESVVIRFIRPDVAVADLESWFVSHSGPAGSTSLPVRTLLFIVVTKDAGQWHIAEVRNTGVPHP